MSDPGSEFAEVASGQQPGVGGTPNTRCFKRVVHVVFFRKGCRNCIISFMGCSPPQWSKQNLSDVCTPSNLVESSGTYAFSTIHKFGSRVWCILTQHDRNPRSLKTRCFDFRLRDTEGCCDPHGQVATVKGAAASNVPVCAFAAPWLAVRVSRDQHGTVTRPSSPFRSGARAVRLSPSRKGDPKGGIRR